MLLPDDNKPLLVPKLTNYQLDFRKYISMKIFPNSNTLILENAFQNVVCNMASFFLRGHSGTENRTLHDEYRTVSNISHTNYQNLNASHLIL